MRLSRLLCVPALILAAPALAQSASEPDLSLADESRLVRSVFVADLEALVASLGHEVRSTGSEGEHSVRAATEDGLIYNVVGTVCDTDIRPGCLGINMNVRYDGDDMVTYEKLNNANLTWVATSTSLEGEIGTTNSTLIISRYVILDGGMTMRNVSDNLTNLLAIAEMVADYVWEVDEDWGEW
jgi:hypothetical protein